MAKLALYLQQAQFVASDQTLEEVSGKLLMLRLLGSNLPVDMLKTILSYLREPHEAYHPLCPLPGPGAVVLGSRPEGDNVL